MTTTTTSAVLATNRSETRNAYTAYTIVERLIGLESPPAQDVSVLDTLYMHRIQRVTTKC